jgi:hypothetical protein
LHSTAAATQLEATMFLIRDIMHCKPGKVRPMVDKMKGLRALGESKGWGKMRVMTDFAAERYWTVVSEMEVPSLEEFTRTSRQSMADPEFRKAMDGYHDLVVNGRREIFIIED